MFETISKQIQLGLDVEDAENDAKLRQWLQMARLV